jgi:pyridoxal phosphate enzyme (YggS family)
VNVAEGVAHTRERIARAAARAGRAPSEVTLVAVSKTFPVDMIVAALDAGVTDVGENRAQELRHKHAALGTRPRWHFVGNLQTNKVRNVVGIAQLIHSVDRMALAEAIARRARGMGIVQDALVEVNVAGEATKSGVAPDAAVELAERASSLQGIEIKGLMTVAPWPDDPEDSRAHYERLASVRDRLLASLPGATEKHDGQWKLRPVLSCRHGRRDRLHALDSVIAARTTVRQSPVQWSRWSR